MTEFPAAPIILFGIFLVFIATAVVGALIAALSARVIRGVCGLAMSSIGLAGLYYFLNSPFLALMEILIYIGAVCVTMVFAIMLAEPEETPVQPTGESSRWWGGVAVVASLALFGGLAVLGIRQEWTPPVTRVSEGSVHDLGVSLLTTYSMAFELISLVLFVAIIGALVIARPGRHLDSEAKPTNS